MKRNFSLVSGEDISKLKEIKFAIHKDDIKIIVGTFNVNLKMFLPH